MEQRQAFIESMVERLAAKMKEEPENLEGWIRLAEHVEHAAGRARLRIDRAVHDARDLPRADPAVARDVRAARAPNSASFFLDQPNRYFDPHFKVDTAKILPGEYYATNKDMALVTVLGSCVSACLRDRETGREFYGDSSQRFILDVT